VIEIGEDARHLAVAKVIDDTNRRIDLNATASTTSLGSTEHNHAVAEKFVTEYAVLLPGVSDLRKVRFDPLATPIAAALDGPRQRREPLDVWRRELG
jgi:hypothetical protein